MTLNEILALAVTVKNETGIDKNTAIRVGTALEEIIKYFRDNSSGSSDGGVLLTPAEMDAAAVGKFYGFQLEDNHPELGVDHGALFCSRAGVGDAVAQLVIVYSLGTMKIYLRGGELNNFGPFNQISGGGGTGGDETDPYFTAWLATSPLAAYVKESDIVGAAATKTVRKAERDAAGNVISTTYTKNADLFTDGQIKSDLLPSSVDDIVDVHFWQENAPVATEGQYWWGTLDLVLGKYKSGQWIEELPLQGKIYLDLSVAGKVTKYRWSGSAMAAIENPIDYTTQAEAENDNPTQNTKLTTIFRVFQGFKYWIVNVTFNGLTTAQKTIQGAINGLKTLVDSKMTESEFVGANATKVVNSAEWANNATNAENAIFASSAGSAENDGEGHSISQQFSQKENTGVAAGLITQLIGGATDDTLKKLQDKITALQAIVGSAAADGDSVVNTLTELLAVFSAYPEGTDIATLIASKVNATDVYNALDCIVSGKVLDARQGKALQDAITALTTTVGGKVDKNGTDRLITTSEAALWNREIIPLVCSDEVSDLTASASVAKIRFVMPGSYTLNNLFAELNTAPTGSSMTIDVKKNGTSIFSTLMTIDATELTSRTAATPHVLTGAISFVLGDYVEVFITIVGSTVAGKGLKVYLLTTKS